MFSLKMYLMNKWNLEVAWETRKIPEDVYKKKLQKLREDFAQMLCAYTTEVHTATNDIVQEFLGQIPVGLLKN